jgi:DNA-binding transcriptional LysR family regulator
MLHCRAVLESLAQGQIAAHQMQGKISGKLRFSISSDLGRYIILPWIDKLIEQHPTLSIDLDIGGSLSGFSLDNVDIVLRYGKREYTRDLTLR